MTLALSSYATDWLDLLLRWLHVIAAIAWIGASFYFIGLDNHLRPPADDGDAEKGVGGEAWEIHGGGFYHVQKYRVTPDEIPEPLLWFKWEAYTTWLSGFALFVVLYYLQADTYLVDRNVADLGAGAAIAISVGLLALSWIVYDVLCRLLGRNELGLGVAVFLFVVVAAYVSGQLFSGRAAYVQVGAMVGTMMAGNVLFNIIPAHRELIRAKQAGREVDPKPGLVAKQRSVHNNYLTLPVVFAMISNHFARAYAHPHAWLVLVAMMAIGAWIRHFFNLRHVGRNAWWVPVTAVAALVGLAFAIRPSNTVLQGSPAAVPFATAQAIVQKRCATCHSGASSPKGIELRTRAQIEARAAQIKAQAVDTHAMPLGNATHMTQAERDLLARWIASR